MVDRCVARSRGVPDLADDVRQEVLLALVELIRAGRTVRNWRGLIQTLARQAWSRVQPRVRVGLPFEPWAHEEVWAHEENRSGMRPDALSHARSILTDRQFRVLGRFLDTGYSRTALACELRLSLKEVREVLRECAKRLQKSPPSRGHLSNVGRVPLYSCPWCVARGVDLSEPSPRLKGDIDVLQIDRPCGIDCHVGHQRERFCRCRDRGGRWIAALRPLVRAGVHNPPGGRSRMLADPHRSPRRRHHVGSLPQRSMHSNLRTLL